jgi:pilus assembly protein Flp/PilA
MKRFTPMPWARMFANEKGVTAIEYGLIAALIAVVIITGVTLIGGNLSATFQSIADKM